MARWHEIEESAPAFAERARRIFDAHKHKTIATVRIDGAPRISGIEAWFDEGDLWFGSMSNARKAADLQRDPRYALHSGSVDPPEWEGDAKLSGRAEEITDPDRESHLFRADVDEAVIVGLNDARNRLVVELWRPGQELKRIERE